MTLEGHVKDILSMDWSPNGHLLASGSNDNTCRIWDIRKRDCTYTLPAHTSLVSQVCLCHSLIHAWYGPAEQSQGDLIGALSEDGLQGN